MERISADGERLAGAHYFCLYCGYILVAGDGPCRRCPECGMVNDADAMRAPMDRLLANWPSLWWKLLWLRRLPVGWWWTYRSPSDIPLSRARMARAVLATSLVLAIVAATAAFVGVEATGFLFSVDLHWDGSRVTLPNGVPSQTPYEGAFGTWTALRRVDSGMVFSHPGGYTVRERNRYEDKIYRNLVFHFDAAGVGDAISAWLALQGCWLVPYLLLKARIARLAGMPDDARTALRNALRNSAAWFPLVGISAAAACLIDLFLRLCFGTCFSPGPLAVRQIVLAVPFLQILAAWAVVLASDRTKKLLAGRHGA